VSPSAAGRAFCRSVLSVGRPCRVFIEKLGLPDRRRRARYPALTSATKLTSALLIDRSLSTRSAARRPPPPRPAGRRAPSMPCYRRPGLDGHRTVERRGALDPGRAGAVPGPVGRPMDVTGIHMRFDTTARRRRRRRRRQQRKM